MSLQAPDVGALQRYEVLLGVLESITRHDDLTELFHDLAQRLRLVVPFDFITVVLYEPAENVMRLHIMESEQPQQVRLGPDTSPVESPGGWVWQAQQPMVIADYEQETRFPRVTPVWRGYGMRSGYYLPLTYRNSSARGTMRVDRPVTIDPDERPQERPRCVQPRDRPTRRLKE
jgi:hypothetical protein